MSKSANYTTTRNIRELQLAGTALRINGIIPQQETIGKGYNDFGG